MGDQAELLAKLKGGWDLASKLAGKGMGEVSGLLSKRDDAKNGQLSGVYWNRGSWSAVSGFMPEIEFFELQSASSGFAAGVMQRFTMSKGERAFMQACQSLIGVNTEQAVGSLQEAIAADTQLTDAYVMLGCMLLEMDNAQEASSYFQKALLCQQGLGQKFKKFLPSFRMAIALSPWSSIALYPDLLGLNILLALAWRKADNLPMAVSVMEQILSIMPESPLAQFFMAVLRLEVRQFKEIAAMFGNIEAVSTIQAANLLILGRACRELGCAQALMEAYERASACTDIDRKLRYDILSVKSELKRLALGSDDRAEQTIKQECPEYVPFFERLGIRIRSASEIKLSVNVPDSASAQQISASAQTVSAAGQAPSAAAAADSAANVFDAIASAGKTVPVGGNAVLGGGAAAVVTGAAVQNDPYTNLSLRSAVSGQVFSLERPVTVIGRESGDILLLGDSSASAKHARIIKDAEGHYFIVDLQSTNGVFINEQRLPSGVRQPLQRGISLRIGNTLFTVV